MDDATGLAEALVGLDRFRVLDVRENPGEVCITVETTADVVGCERCGVRALAKKRKRVDIRDLTCFGCPARLVWLKRRWCCADPDCEQKTWTEGSPHVPSRSVLTVTRLARHHHGSTPKGKHGSPTRLYRRARHGVPARRPINAPVGRRQRAGLNTQRPAQLLPRRQRNPEATATHARRRCGAARGGRLPGPRAEQDGLEQ